MMLSKAIKSCNTKINYFSRASRNISTSSPKLKFTSHTITNSKSGLKSALNELSQRCADDLKTKNPSVSFLWISEDFADYDELKVAPKLLYEAGLESKALIGAVSKGASHKLANGKKPTSISLMCGQVAEGANISFEPFHTEDSSLPNLDAIQLENKSQLHFALVTDGDRFDEEKLIRRLDFAFPHSTKVGGLASADKPCLFMNKMSYTSGCTGLVMRGDIRVSSLSAHSTRPVGPVVQVTKSKGNVIHELNGRPATSWLLEIYDSLCDADKKLADYLLLGLDVHDISTNGSVEGAGTRQKVKRGSHYLVRNVLGVSKLEGTIICGDPVRPGQHVQFQLPDPTFAQTDLRVRMHEHNVECHMNGTPCDPVGILNFTSFGKLLRLGPTADSKRKQPEEDDDDVHIVNEVFPGVPSSGIYCNGEFERFKDFTELNGYTTSLALIEAISK